MNRKHLVLAALAASNGAVHTPVQVQKLFFLLDKRISTHLGGPWFNFAACDYGPFDRAVYDELENLEREGLVEITRTSDLRRKTYRLTAEGQGEGNEILKGLDTKLVEYLQRLSKWVRSLSFAELVSSIYREYPEMKVNSVFRG